MPSYTCPTCSNTIQVKQRSDALYRPFCSRRCEMIDLARWFNEEYSVEVPLGPVDADPEAPPDPQN